MLRVNQFTGFGARRGGISTLVLDDIAQNSANITAAYSAVRRLRVGYTGSLIRVQRSSDSTEQDIGYGSNNLLDQSALTTFVGAGTGRVVKWYDQGLGAGGAGPFDLSAADPKIIQTGTMETAIGGNPCIYFDGSVDFFPSDEGDLLEEVISKTNGYTIMASMRPTAGGADADATAYNNATVFGGYSSGYLGIHIKSGTPGRIQFYQFTGTHDVVGVDMASALPDTVVAVMKQGSGTMHGYLNGGAGASMSSGANATVSQRWAIGAGYSGAATFTGHVGEFVIFDRPLTASDINIVGTTMAHYAGVTWTTIS